MRVSYGRNSAGALEITDANEYYPFGMNHLKTGNAYFAQGSYKSNKYNGKELQETGMYSYGWREYMSDIGRWNGIDQLAESYVSASPYAYVLNNPINMFDPDGRISEAFTANVMNFPSGTTFYNNNDGTWSINGSGMAVDGNGVLISGHSSGGGGSSAGDVAGTIDIPGMDLTGTHNNWGQSFQNSFNSYMNNWNNINWWSNAGAMAYTGTLTLPTGGGASAGTWASISETWAALAGVLRAGQWGLLLMLNGDSSSARGYDIPLTGATDIPADEPQNNLYLYRIMRNVNGLPMVGTGLDKLGLRDRDINNLPNSSRITNLFENGLSVTAGYGNVIPPNVPDFSGGKGTLFRIPASSLISYGLIGVPVPNANIPNYGQIRPAVPMTVGAFRALIQSTAPAWQPVK